MFIWVVFNIVNMYVNIKEESFKLDRLANSDKQRWSLNQRVTAHKREEEQHCHNNFPSVTNACILK